ncbi:MAG: SH3 domain-containing protein [Clostridiaceae bacterium]|nr:SH3 domain-containing protein [Eubacteriales bacterium]
MLKRMLATLLAASLLLLLGAPALAATAQAEYRIATANVNVRSGPSSEKYPVIGSLKKGELVTYLGKDGNWSKVSYQNGVGYVFSQYLADLINTPVKYYRTATANVNVRSGPNSTTYPVIGSLKKGETVQYLGMTGNWCLVLYKGDIGFVFSEYMSAKTTDGSTPTAQYRMATANVNVRTGPSSSKYPAIGALKKGETVQYLGTTGNWTQVLYKGETAYVFSKYLTAAANPSPAEYRTATTNVNVRTGPGSAKYPVMGSLVKGEKVQYLGVSGNWTQVLYKGQVGYVFSKYLAK